MLTHLNPQVIAQVLGVVATAIIVTNGFVTFAKQVIETKLDPVTNKKAHDASVQFAAILGGIGSTFGLVFALFPPVSSQMAVLSGIVGYAVGLAAMGNYAMLTALLKVLSGGVLPDPVPPVTEQQAPAPAPLLPTPKAGSDSPAAPVPTSGSASASTLTELTPLVAPSTGGTVNTP